MGTDGQITSNEKYATNTDLFHFNSDRNPKENHYYFFEIVFWCSFYQLKFYYISIECYFEILYLLKWYFYISTIEMVVTLQIWQIAF